MPRRFWAGLDVGLRTTSLCVLDDAGHVLQEGVCASSLDIVDHEIRWLRRRRFARVGLEAGVGMSLARGLRSRGYSVDIYETRQLSRFLRARRNKTDAGDASGIAEAGRVGTTLVSRVHLKDLECQQLQSLLTIRRHLIRQRVAGVNLLCRQLEVFGGALSPAQSWKILRSTAESEMKKLFGKVSSPLTTELRLLLDHCEDMMIHQQALDAELRKAALASEVCQRFMAIPGVGPICALTFLAVVAEPQRFRRSADVGAYLGLTPTVHQSGVTTRKGRISKMGNSAMRSLLVHASIKFRTCSSPCGLLDWASQIEQRRGRLPARVALARKLATVMVAMWKSGESYSPRPGNMVSHPRETGPRPRLSAASGLDVVGPVPTARPGVADQRLGEPIGEP